MMQQQPPVNRRPTIEICVESLEGIEAAVEGGADRIELCAALAVGGLTPSAGLVEAALTASAAPGIPVFAMVRTRSGGFDLEPGELTAAIADARALIAAGVDGLVFGATRRDRIDAASCQRWINAIRDAAGYAIPCTFHRAIDVVADPLDAVDVLAELGFDRVLTSGGKGRAIDGADTIAAMVSRAAGRIAVIGGSGVTPENVATLVAITGVQEVHASASRPVHAIDPRLVDLGFTPAIGRATCGETVRALRSALDKPHSIGH